VSSVPIVPDAVNQMLDKLSYSGDVSSLLLFAASKSQDVSAQSKSGRRLLASQDLQGSIVSKVSAAISENAKSFDANSAKDALQSLAKVVADPSLLSSQTVSNVIGSSRLLVSALKGSSLEAGGTAHLAGFSCISSVVQATVSSTTRNS
jgi:hypothetical protein